MVSLLSKYNLFSAVILDGNTLSLSSNLKILGVTLDSYLNFSHLLFPIIYSSYFYIQAMKQVRKFIPLATANALTISLVFYRLNYCSFPFCGQPTYLLRKLQSIKNHAAKTVLQADYFSSSSERLDCLHWLPVFKKCKFKYFCLMACVLKLKQPTYLFDLFSIRLTNQPLRSMPSGLQLH